MITIYGHITAVTDSHYHFRCASRLDSRRPELEPGAAAFPKRLCTRGRRDELDTLRMSGALLRQVLQSPPSPATATSH